jgi:pSer/pThr/pTyr-binding forkhead associated (FHA) protein
MPQIVVTLGGNVVNKYVFDKDIMSIGRSRDNDIVVENLAVSRNHARVRREDDRYILTDLNSANGTFLNGVQITKAELHHEDVVTIGKHKLIFQDEALSDEALISDAFGAERTMLLDKAPVAYLVVTRGKQKDLEFRLDKAEVAIGRGADCDITLHDWFVSKQHAVVHRQGNTFMLRDAGSWRGTKVNEIQVTETVLKDGDEIQMGGTRLVFRVSEEEMPRQLESRTPMETPAPEPVAIEEPAPPPEAEAEPASAFEEEETPAEETPAEPAPAMEGEGFGESSERLLTELDEELREGAEMIREVVSEVGSVLEPEGEEPAAAEEEEVREEAFADDEQPSTEPALAATMVDAPAEEEQSEEPAAAELQYWGEETPEPAAEEPDKVELEAEVVESEAVEIETEEPVSAETEAAEAEAMEPEAPEAETVEAAAEGAPTEEQTRDAPPDEVQIWEEALKNKSGIIRKQAAQMLKKLTGKDYDY